MEIIPTLALLAHHIVVGLFIYVFLYNRFLKSYWTEEELVIIDYKDKTKGITFLMAAYYLVIIISILLSLTYNNQLSNLQSTIIGQQYNTKTQRQEDTKQEEYISLISQDIVFTDENYLENIIKLMYNFNQYHGGAIEISGFIYMEESKDEHSFIIAREVITCCDAHAEIIGIQCYWENQLPKENSWVKITGYLQSIYAFDEKLKGEVNLPLIIVDSIEEILPPEDPYLYP
ncbi:TIGR03943 family putative permease subunit [Alkaliphilus peptidifermentans]|uniref:Putative membrane protein n=1 Tax=Alkaliphilus peptidifermentans DSM 18978 TaxID=1120976 RepID=A0A1G5J3G6_9FIRM|nr:TIGR03943 family protein [Alkaliphilus peptidifermentans]SCY82822.1 putative membrane protein [Alkaliphilus peptidifermentans DSM 18978]